ncbi:MAG: hypothetical protein ABGW66_02445 [Flavobacteriaceae bacterium]|jgi:hypothetical protein
MATIPTSKIIGGVGAGVLVNYLENRTGATDDIKDLSNIVPIALAGASVLGFVPKIGGIGKIIGQVGEASIGLVAYKLIKSQGLFTPKADNRIFHRSVSPVNTFTGDMSLSGL